MIESIRLRDFQAHEDLIVPLGQVTTVVGPSRQGKSSILRGLRWLTFNRPSGSAFVRHGRPGAKVSVKADGRTVARVKGKGRNLYLIDGKKLKAFGANVPDEVARLLNLSELNFATQFAPHFWVLSSPAEVSRELNAVVNLDLIDRVMARMAAGVRKAKGEEEFVRGRVKSAREARNRLAWVGEAKAELDAVREKYNEVSRLEETARRLSETLSQGKRAARDAETLLEAARGLERVLKLGSGAAETGGKAARLATLLRDLRVKEEEREEAERELAILEGELAKVKSCPVCRKPMKP